MTNPATPHDVASSARPCDECGEPVSTMEEWQQSVEGGAGIARGHRQCIEAEWGPVEPITKREVVREFFVANVLDGDDSGRVTFDAATLADVVAEMFSSDAWDETVLAAIHEQYERLTGAAPGSSAATPTGHDGQ